jgi:uncharacterized membrane protein (UPF0182 family)
VRPFYVTSSETEVPGLEKVIVYFEGEVVIRDTLQQALEVVFGEAPPTLEEDDPTDPTDPEEPTEPDEPTGTVAERVARLLIEANDLFEQADAALPDFAEYAALNRQARAKIAQAERLLEEAGAAPTTTTTTEGASA